MDSRCLDLSGPGLRYRLGAGDRLTLDEYGIPSRRSWCEQRGDRELFAVYAGGCRMDAGSPCRLTRATSTRSSDGALHSTVDLAYDTHGLGIEVHRIAYPDTTVVEHWICVRNAGVHDIVIDRIDSISLIIPAADYDLMYFTSSWGQEFETRHVPLDGPITLETRTGRSSNGMHPWFALTQGDGEVLSGAVMWSGNWVLRFEPLNIADGVASAPAFRISGGLHDWEFSRCLRPGDSLESPHVSLVLASHADLNAISSQFAHVGRRYWYPRNQLSDRLPVEWNHWWAYEDTEINEETFRANVDIAARLGIEVCTLDAGWFGPASDRAHWYDYRGDWDLVNTARFPRGIRYLSDYVHQKGMKFGLWCEIEGLGRRSRLAASRPDLAALRSGDWLGYVCLGHPDAREWAVKTLDRLITQYACDWIKLDFNVDPGAGCNRLDHGHDAGDGLYEHYRGYYAVLERIRAGHPEVVLENCSSGGLRIDLGMASQTHLTFLSDLDLPEHALQVLSGATTMLAPSACLLWRWSQRIGEHAAHGFNPRNPSLTDNELDHEDRISMLGVMGYSQRLPDLPRRVADRFARNIAVYKHIVRRFVHEGILYRLTDEPKRDDRRDGWAAFQYTLSESDEHLLFVFRLLRTASVWSEPLKCLEVDQLYAHSSLGEKGGGLYSGSKLMSDGLALHLHGTSTAIILIQPQTSRRLRLRRSPDRSHRSSHHPSGGPRGGYPR